MKETTVPTTITIGVDVGQRQDPSAVVIAEQFPGDRHRIHRIERLALQTAYPDVARRLAAVYNYTVTRMIDRQAAEDRRRGVAIERLSREFEPSEDAKSRRARERVDVLVDASGCGLPVCDFLRQSAGIAEGHLTGVIFTAGSGVNVRRGDKDGTVSKTYLISRLKSLVGFGRLEWPRTAAGRELADELNAFEFAVNDNATLTWNARPGMHDDLVCACALAVLAGPPDTVWSTRYA
jgi:hypothetical protein